MKSEPVAIITAGAGAIGGACARELNARGYRLVLMSTSGKAEELAAELGGVGFSGSVTDTNALRHCVELAEAHFGRVDAVVNNTGHTRSVDTGELLWNRDYQGYRVKPDATDDYMLEISDDDWHAALDLLFLNVVRMARFATDVIRRSGGGSIVNVSSYVAKEPSLSLPVGSSIRGALGNFTKLYSDRYGADGIRMNTVLPGHVENWPGREKVKDLIPLGRSAGVDEIGKVVGFLVSPDSGYMTGQSILVDGGRNRAP